MNPTFTFYTSVERGRYEREFELEVTYTVTPRVAATRWQPEEGGEVEILEVTHNDCLFETTSDEDDGIQDAAERRADADLAAWRDDQDCDDADYRRDERRAA